MSVKSEYNPGTNTPYYYSTLNDAYLYEEVEKVGWSVTYFYFNVKMYFIDDRVVRHSELN